MSHFVILRERYFRVGLFMDRVFYSLSTPDAPGVYEMVSIGPRRGSLETKADVAFGRECSRRESDSYPPGVFQILNPPINGFPDLFPAMQIEFGKKYNGQFFDRFTYYGRDLLSARCRACIEETDPNGGHQFIEATILNGDTPADLPTYYWFVNGRVFGYSENENGQAIPSKQLSIRQHKEELASEERAEFLIQFPIWSLSFPWAVRKMNQDMYSAINDAGLTGFEAYRIEQNDEGPEASGIYGSLRTVRF